MPDPNFYQYCVDLLDLNSETLISLEDCFYQLKKVLKLPDETVRSLLRTMREKGLITVEVGVKKEKETRKK
jgi:DNA-binding IclR family transcriptional regulator